MNEHVREQLWHEAIRIGMTANALLLYVQPSLQRLDVLEPGGLVAGWPISTSANGLGEEQHSGQTPRGWHEVVKIIGQELPVGAVLKSRRFTGQVLPPDCWFSDNDDDLILSRILWLSGREPSRNCGPRAIDTCKRLIYIHGTNHEQHLGAPASRGCIRMGNHAVVALAELGQQSPLWVYVNPE